MLKLHPQRVRRALTSTLTVTLNVAFALAFITTFYLVALQNDAHSAQKSSDKSKVRPQTIFAAGDIADCRRLPAAQTKAAKTADLVRAGIAQDPDAYVITLGDATYPNGKPSEFADCYDKTWGEFKNRTLPAPGNHEYGVPMAHGYFNYFDALAGPDRRGYYKKQLGSWMLLSLNSNISGKAMEEQLQWLRKELHDNKMACTLAYWHHPVFSSGGHGNNTVMLEVWKILAEAKVDLVLSGHDHNYERFIPLNATGFRDDKNGIRSFIVGTGGAKLTPMFFPKSSTEIRDNDTHGVLKLELNADSYEWEFLPIAGQILKDRGHADCH